METIVILYHPQALIPLKAKVMLLNTKMRIKSRNSIAYNLAWHCPCLRQSGLLFWCPRHMSGHQTVSGPFPLTVYNSYIKYHGHTFSCKQNYTGVVVKKFCTCHVVTCQKICSLSMIVVNCCRHQSWIMTEKSDWDESLVLSIPCWILAFHVLCFIHSTRTSFS